MKKSFRLLLLAAFLAHAVGLFVLPNLPWLYTEEAIALSQYSGYGAHVDVHHKALYVLYLLPYPSYIAAFFFLNLGRLLFVLYIGGLLVSTFLFGVSVSGPPDTFLSLFSVLLDGGLLALMWLSPISRSFVPLREFSRVWRRGSGDGQ